MRHDQLKHRDDFEIVELREKVADARPRPETAVPDVPTLVGVMMVAVYAIIVGLFAATIASAGQGPFMIAVDLAFLASFFAVPLVFLRQEGDPARRPSLSRFLAQGMQTYTGHVSGGGALVQMFIVPVLLAFAVLGIGIIVMVA